MVLLLRHGETTWNVSGRMQGRSNTPLSDAGIEQTLAAIPFLPQFARILSSPLERAMVTARMIGQQTGSTVHSDIRLIERSWGAWEGLTPEEVEAQFPGAMASEAMPEGYEEDQPAFERLESLLLDLGKLQLEQGLLLVTHGGLMAATVRELKGPHIRFKNLEGQWIAIEGDTLTLGDRIEYVPSARRLER